LFPKIFDALQAASIPAEHFEANVMIVLLIVFEALEVPSIPTGHYAYTDSFVFSIVFEALEVPSISHNIIVNITI